jgi:hypothetical protein
MVVFMPHKVSFLQNADKKVDSDLCISAKVKSSFLGDKFCMFVIVLHLIQYKNHMCLARLRLPAGN